MKFTDRPFDQDPFIRSIEFGSMVNNKVYDGNNNEIRFDPPIFDHVAQKLYLRKESYVPPIFFEGEVYCFIKAFADNYAHWIYDILPCFRLFDYNAKKIHINYSKKFQKEFLEILNVRKENVIPYPEVSSIKCDILNFVYSGSRYCIEDFYNNLKKNLNLKSNKHKKIYISREKSEFRKVLNEEDLLKILESRGFAKYFLEDMSVMEQIELFNSADLVVMPHGAGAANLFFCCENTKVIQFWPNKLFKSSEIYPKKLHYYNFYEQSFKKDCMKVNINRLSHILDGTF